MTQNEEIIRTPGTVDAERRGKTAEATERVIDSAVELGRVWARYGLSIGKMALETSATSLKTTAGLLGAVADAFESEPTARAPGASESTERRSPQGAKAA